MKEALLQPQLPAALCPGVGTVAESGEVLVTGCNLHLYMAVQQQVVESSLSAFGRDDVGFCMHLAAEQQPQLLKWQIAGHSGYCSALAMGMKKTHICDVL